jgi:hypothetical protein
MIVLNISHQTLYEWSKFFFGNRKNMQIRKKKEIDLKDSLYSFITYLREKSPHIYQRIEPALVYWENDFYYLDKSDLTKFDRMENAIISGIKKGYSKKEMAKFIGATQREMNIQVERVISKGEIKKIQMSLRRFPHKIDESILCFLPWYKHNYKNSHYSALETAFKLYLKTL